jgi:hypothetical protein
VKIHTAMTLILSPKLYDSFTGRAIFGDLIEITPLNGSILPGI